MRDFLFRSSIAELDPQLEELLGIEAERQERKLIMIASESTAPPAVRQAAELLELRRIGVSAHAGHSRK